MCRTYWRAGARHYRVAVMTRASQQALSVPGVARHTHDSDTKEHRRSNPIADSLSATGTSVNDFNAKLY